MSVGIFDLMRKKNLSYFSRIFLELVQLKKQKKKLRKYNKIYITSLTSL